MNGAYFTTGATTRGPLTALQNGTDGGNGLYRYTTTPSTFPDQTFNSENYWVDVVFEDGPDTARPTVTAGPRRPAPPSGLRHDVTATFSEPVQPDTITFELSAPAAPSSRHDVVRRDQPDRDPGPDRALAASTTYTASSAVLGTPPATRWTRCRGPSPLSPPRSAARARSGRRPPPPPPGPGHQLRRAGSEVPHLRRRLRHRDPLLQAEQATGTHVGSLWTRTGTRLGQVTFTGESASGWQQATFDSPIPVTANTTYVASYFTPTSYAVTGGYFTSSATTRGPLTALQNGTDGGNGIYRYTSTAGTFPNLSFGAENYWVDVVLPRDATDTTPPTVTTRVPAPDATGVPVSVRPSATFSESVTGSTVSMVLRTSGRQPGRPSTTSYDAGDPHRHADPDHRPGPLDRLHRGGERRHATPRQHHGSGVVVASRRPPRRRPASRTGPGGPIAVVTSSRQPVVVLPHRDPARRGAQRVRQPPGLRRSTPTTWRPTPWSSSVTWPITDAQVTALTDWVNAGGNLVAMRPDSRLYALAGIAAQTGTVADGYVAVNAATEPGAGITTDTMQFHGTANRYALDGATSVATLYSSATASTGLPAGDVAERRHQRRPGRDLRLRPRPLGHRHPAGQPRLGRAEPRRATPQPVERPLLRRHATDWVNLSKAHIPQADEQQRLLANLITVTARDRLPMPRFWYFPGTTTRPSSSRRVTTTAAAERRAASAPTPPPAPRGAPWPGGSARASRPTSTPAPR